MISTDTLTCQVTPDSVEPTSLSCSMLPLEWLDLWTMLGAWATVGATLLLALFAWLAWRASSKNLELMRAQLTVTENAASSQIEDQEWDRQVAVLATYISALRELADLTAAFVIDGGSGFTPLGYEVPPGRSNAADVKRATSKVSSAGLIWRLQHAKSSDSLESLRTFEDALLQNANAVTFGVGGWAEIQVYASILRARATEWQSDTSKRPSVAQECENAAFSLRTQLSRHLLEFDAEKDSPPTEGEP